MLDRLAFLTYHAFIAIVFCILQSSRSQILIQILLLLWIYHETPNPKGHYYVATL